MSNKIGSLAVQITGSTTGLSAALSDAQSKTQKFHSSLKTDLQPLKIGDDLGKRIGGGGGVRSAFAGIGTFIASEIVSGVKSGMGALKDFIGESINLAADMESTLTTFEVFLNSAEEARSLNADLQELAKRTALSPQQVNDSAKTLLGGGFNKDQVAPITEMLGHYSIDGVKELSILLTQVSGKGQLYAEEAQQFAEKGIGIYQILGKAFGKTDGEMRSMVSAGKVSSKMLIESMHLATQEGGKFHGMLDKQGQNFHGLKATLDATFQESSRAFGKILMDELDLKGLVKELTGTFDLAGGEDGGLRKFVKEFKPIVWDFAKCSVDLLKAAKWLMDFTQPALHFANDLRTAIDKFGDYVFIFSSSVDKQSGEVDDKGAGDYSGDTGTGGFFDPFSEEFQNQKPDAKGGIPGLVDGLGQDHIAKIKSVMADYNPLAALQERISDLHRIKDLGGFKDNPDAFNFAVGKELKDALKDYMGEQKSLAQNAAQGSVEAASIIASANADNARDIEQETIQAIHELDRTQAKQLEIMRLIHGAVAGKQLLGIK